jgi:hypothetical protein
METTGTLQRDTASLLYETLRRERSFFDDVTDLIVLNDYIADCIVCCSEIPPKKDKYLKYCKIRVFSGACAKRASKAYHKAV